jgi:hypothetical protein
MRSRMASGTFGRPSGSRSPDHSDVRATTSAGVGVMLWAGAKAGARSALPRATYAMVLIGSPSWGDGPIVCAYGRYSARPILESAMP